MGPIKIKKTILNSLTKPKTSQEAQNIVLIKFWQNFNEKFLRVPLCICQYMEAVHCQIKVFIKR